MRKQQYKLINIWKKLLVSYFMNFNFREKKIIHKYEIYC